MVEKSIAGVLTQGDVEAVARRLNVAPTWSMREFAYTIEAAVIAKLEPAARERERAAWDAGICYRQPDPRLSTTPLGACDIERDRLYPSLTPPVDEGEREHAEYRDFRWSFTPPPPLKRDEGVVLSGHRYRLTSAAGALRWEIFGWVNGVWSGMKDSPCVATAEDADKLADYLRGRGGLTE